MIIVTGGSGFIGSALVWRLNQLGTDDIFIVDHFANDEKFRNLIPLRFKDVFDKEEFLEKEIFYDLLKDENIDTIFHLGACSSTTEANFDYLLRNNFEYSKELCLGALDFNARFIYASSAATYGDGSKGYKDDEKALQDLSPLNGYGYSKHLFDLWVRDNGYSDQVAGLKYFNVYGPNEYHKKEMRSVVHKCFGQIKESGKAKLFKSTSDKYGDGEQKRDFIYVKDAVEMTLHFYENKDLNGIFNIGTGEANSFNSFIKPIFKTLNLPENIEYFDMPENLIEKYQDFTCADTDKLKKSGYKKPITNIEDAVTDYVKNYLDMKNIYLH